METEEALEQLRDYGAAGQAVSREACRDALARVAELEEQLRNSEIFRRNLIEEYREMRREIGQLLETWDNLKEYARATVWLERIRRRVDDLRPWAPGVLREDGDGAPLPPEVQL
jgi:hypothetical protein